MKTLAQGFNTAAQEYKYVCNNAGFLFDSNAERHHLAGLPLDCFPLCDVQVVMCDGQQLYCVLLISVLHSAPAAPPRATFIF